MKITKAKLKQIVKEELQAVVAENQEEFVKYAPDGTRLGKDDVGLYISDSLEKFYKNPRRRSAKEHIDMLVKHLVEFFGEDPDDARDRVNAEIGKGNKKAREKRRSEPSGPYWSGETESDLWKMVYGKPSWEK